MKPKQIQADIQQYVEAKKPYLPSSIVPQITKSYKT